MDSWNKLPLDLIDDMARRESYNRYHYRPVYSLHKWWARRPGSTFRLLGLACLTDDDVGKDDLLKVNKSGRYEGQYLQHQEDKFTDATVLDPFAGGGTSLVELNRLGADTVGYELNPVAWWTIKKTIEDVDLEALNERFETVLADMREELDQYYQTIDPETGRECDVLYTFYSQEVPCLTCDETVRLFKNYRLAKKRKNSPGVVYCPNDECSDRIIELDREIQSEETCPSCGTTFEPSDGNYGRGKYTCSQGHKHDVRDTLDRLDQKPQFDCFAIQYETPTGEKKFKECDEGDADVLAEVVQEFERLEDSLPIPDQRIPIGDETKRAVDGYNFERFSDFFTDRQLLTFGKLIERIREVDDRRVRELLFTTVSKAIEYNSLLCRWEYNYKRATSVFERHTYQPKVQPVEGNPLNRRDNLSSLTSAFRKVYDAKEYCEQPFEKMKEKGSVNKYPVQNESISDDRLVKLESSTSESIDLPDGSVDYIVTDPPYYDNVQYSELSDYFYVWLRECLHGEYEEFEPELVPKAREIVANTQAEKDEEFFIDSLSNVFAECYRVLDNDGEMVFTYHHNENEAWAVILEALIESGFTVTAAYPVQAETDNNMHITDLDNTEYDIVIFANKEDSDEEITLEGLRQNLFFELQDMIDEERDRHESLNQADLGVILRGKCMYYYSKHYPEVYANGEQVGVDEALATVNEVIEQVLAGTPGLPSSIDGMTQAYAAFRQRGPEPYDVLKHNLLPYNLDVSDLEDEQLVRGSRDEKEPVTAEERVTHIERKLNGNGLGDDQLLDIDRVQYLYHLYRTDQNTAEYLKEWKDNDLEELAEFMADVTGDDRYESVMDLDLNLNQF